MRHEVEIVPLAAPPCGSGLHLLDIDVLGQGTVTILAEPVGRPRDGGYPLHVKPVTRVQMAELFALVERMDEPSRTVPPEPPSADPLEDDVEPSHDTLVDDGAGTLSAIREANSELPVRPAVTPPPRPLPRPAPPPVPLAPPPKADPMIGRLIGGRYRIERLIGRGNAGAVYRGLHTELKRPVAIKILLDDKRRDHQFVGRFKAEALATSRLDHPNVTRVLDFGQDDVLYLVMEFVDGKSLESMIESEGRLPMRRAVEIAMQVCLALARAHDEGIIHRDVKPENIMLVASRDDDGEPCDLAKVCDFGLAKLREPAADGDELTMAGMLCGSPAYMSPEQVRGEPLDARTDIYSVGVTLFEVLTGELPHEAHSLQELFTRKITEPPKNVTSLVPDLDPLLADIVMRAIATDANARHPTVRALRAELRQALELMPRERESIVIAG